MESWIQETQQAYFSGYPFIEYGVGGYLILVSFLLFLKCLSCNTKHPSKFQVIRYNPNQTNTNSSQQIETQNKAIQQINDKINQIQSEYDKLAKDNVQLRAILSDLQQKVFEILTKKTNSNAPSSVRSQIIPNTRQESKQSDQIDEPISKREEEVIQEQQQQQQQQQQQEQQQQEEQQDQQQIIQKQEETQQQQEQKVEQPIIEKPIIAEEKQEIQQQPEQQQQTNPFANEQPPLIKRPLNPPTPRRIPPQLRPK